MNINLNKQYLLLIRFVSAHLANEKTGEICSNACDLLCPFESIVCVAIPDIITPVKYRTVKHCNICKFYGENAGKHSGSLSLIAALSCPYKDKKTTRNKIRWSARMYFNQFHKMCVEKPDESS